MNPTIRHLATFVAALLLTACASTPERIEVLEDARATIDALERHPRAESLAGEELADARNALRNAELLRADRADYDDIYHEAYLALRHAEIAQERIAEAITREQIESSEAERNRVLLLAREAEAAAALERAREREREAEAARSIAQIHQEDAEQARDLASQRAAEAARSQRRSELAEQRAQTAIEEQQRLQAMLDEMEAEKTSRGYVLTLGDILFDTDESTLKPGAGSSMDELAQFLQEFPDRRLLIEGHTDARGSETYNLALSEARARAVERALIDRGIGPGRLEVRPMGEEFPVASNETMAGMLQNRRVEIVVSEPDGEFPASALRTVSSY